MADDTQPHRPGPRPRDPAVPTSDVVDRRKVILGIGLGVATAATLRNVNDLGVAAADAASTINSVDDRAGESSSREAVSVTESAPFEPPILDASTRLAAGQQADYVLNGGRIIDPESGFDRIGNVALLGGKIVEISDEAIAGTEEIDLTGQVVSPGFIDILSYEPNGYGEWWKVADGVTSNIGMHGLRFDATDFYDDWSTNGVPVHFGGAVHNSFVRQSVGLRIDEEASDASVDDISAIVETQLGRGFLGIHVQPEYAPGVSANELLDMGRVAARLDVPLCVHARFSDNVAPGVQSDATSELVEVARETGCHVHVEHLNSTGGTGRMREALAEFDAAIAEGLRMSSCMYPYEFWATYLQSTRFNGWQEKFGLSFDDLQVAGTNTRLDEQSYREALDANMLTAAFAIPETDILDGFAAPYMMIGSDSILERSHNNHPRSTGCFSRVLGEYVREQGAVSMIDALAMMTIRPSRLLSLSAPAMETKGRMQIGADADVTVFDPATVRDRSTIADPAIESEGISHVFVDGTRVRAAGVNDQSLNPGTPIRSRFV